MAEPANNNQSVPGPVILCHVACSGGSLIFRKLCQHFGLWGLTETSPWAAVNPRSFAPLDPQQMMLVNGWISAQQFEDLYRSRIQYCDQQASQQGQSLLIREHTHSLFFEPDNPLSMSHFSWFVGHQDELFGRSARVILSVRDPIDSWLGLRSSFPRISDYGFDSYCEKYNRFLDLFDQQQGQVESLMFKYEDFVVGSDQVFERIANQFQLQEATVSGAADFASSGNSGRQSEQLGLRPRRPFTADFLAAVRDSDQYRRLAERLEYPVCDGSVALSDRMRLCVNGIRKSSVNAVRFLLKPLRTALQRISVSE